MSAKISPVEIFDIVVFGATGDLALRKLFPALYCRFLNGQIQSDFRVLGVSLSNYTHEDFRKKLAESLNEFVDQKDLKKEVVESFLARVEYLSKDLTKAGPWEDVTSYLNQYPDRIRIFYLSVDPKFFGVIAKSLAKSELNKQNARLVVEKPFGHNEETAKELNRQLGKAFPENAIYRIDHYLGKETVQNLMAFRFANALFEQQWNSVAIDHVQITVAEKLGIGKRGRYYDSAGAMRDMVQNHLLQLLCLIAMEPPYSFQADALRDEKIKVLRSLRRLEGANVLNNTCRGQYLSSKDEPGYLEEIESESSNCETFVALKVEIENWRWHGVPFYLRTGKKLRESMAEIAVVFKKPHYSLFRDLTTPLQSNTLVIRLQPDEGLSLSVMTKDPGYGSFRLDQSELDMSFTEGADDNFRVPNPYERLLMDIVRGDQSLFMRRDEVEEAWKWVDPIINAWQASGEKPESYDARSSGPASAMELLVAEGRRWRDIAL